MDFSDREDTDNSTCAFASEFCEIGNFQRKKWLNFFHSSDLTDFWESEHEKVKNKKKKHFFQSEG